MVKCTFIQDSLHRSLAYILVISLISTTGLSAQTAAPPSETLKVVVVEGGGAINNIAARTAREPVVRVLDAAGKPVAGATVAFTAPSTGAGGVFGDGSSVFTVQSGPDGLAAARGFKPNKAAGQFSIRVLASFNGQTGRATVLQTNATPAASGSNRKKAVIAGLVVGAVAGGVLAAKGGGGGGSTPQPSTVAAPTPGSPTFVPPR